MNASTTCTTCGRPADSPHRRTNMSGIIIEGCVDSAHNDHADAWHLRPEAEPIRAAMDAYRAECAASLAQSLAEVGR